MVINSIYNYLKVLLLSAPLLLLACRKDGFGDGTASDEVAFSFTLPDEPAVRAVIGSDGSGFFKEGDRISLYIGDAPAKHYILTLRNGEWTPRLSRQDLGTGLESINACYPADENAQSDIMRYTFSISTDQRGEGYETSDILWAHKTVNTEDLPGNRIELPFAHGLHRLRIVVTSDSGELPSDLELAIKSPSSGHFSLFTGLAMADDSDMEWITPKPADGEAGTYWALLMPHSLKDLQSGEGWIRITANGKTAYYDAPSKIGGSNTLQQGKESVVTLRLKDGGVVDPDPDPEPDPGLEPDPEWANEKRWVFGVTSPVFDPETAVVVQNGSSNYPLGKWVIFRTNWSDGTYTDYHRLPWIKGCGWYDVSKTYLWDGAKDANLCWAATTSNIMYWWMEHNAPYIEAYDREYGETEYHQRFPRPSAVFEPYPVLSDIFNRLFVNTFTDRGAGEGVNWFINGSQGYGTSGIKDPQMVDFKGYFNKVFSGVAMYEHNGSMSKANLNRVMKDALVNRKAISLVINGNHNMTIWGAEFDDQGYVSYIYYVDNNPYGEPDPGGASMFRMEVSYREDAVMNLKDQAYMGPNRISSLGAIPLRQDVWSQAFPDVENPETRITGKKK